MKKLILLIAFLCIAVSAQASKVVTPANPANDYTDSVVAESEAHTDAAIAAHKVEADAHDVSVITDAAAVDAENTFAEDQTFEKDITVTGDSNLDGGATIGGATSRMTFDTTTEYLESTTGTWIVASGSFETTGGSKSLTIRIISTASPYTVIEVSHKIFCDTTGGDITILLPAGVNGTEYVIYNTGANDVIVTPNGAEEIDGANSTKTFAAGVLTITYETTEGWW